MKLSPVSIVYRSVQRGASIGFLALFAASAGVTDAIGGPIVVGTLAVAFILAMVGYEVAYYQRFEYELTADTFDIRSGVLSRRAREIPYRRIQNVDISRNVVQRLLGIAAVGFETAGGRQTEGEIRYVSVLEAERLQEEIQQRKRTSEPDTDRPVVPDELFNISPKELALAGLFSFDTRIVGGAGLLASGSVPVLSRFIPDPLGIILSIEGVLIVAGLVIASWLLGAGVVVANYYGFRLSRVDDELRYERGLFRRFTGSIPLSKVQSITIEENPLKRVFGFATLTVDTAGYAPGQSGAQGSQAAIPIASRARVRSLANEIESYGDPAFAQPPKRIRRRYAARYLIAIGAITGIAYAVNWYVAVPLPWYGLSAAAVVVPAMAHLKWKHRGYWIGPAHVVTRNGYWNRSTTVVPYYRIQTVIDARTVFQRRWDVATVDVDTAGSRSILGAGAAAVDIDITDAVAVREGLIDRLQQSLVARRREHGVTGRQAPFNPESR